MNTSDNSLAGTCRSSRPRFVAIGVDHTTADVDSRARLAFSKAEIPVALQQLTDPDKSLLEQAAILSTCNRVEIYGVTRSPTAESELPIFLARYHDLHLPDVARTLSLYRDNQVAHRLAATAAGIHSMVLGEAQILGQVRTALELSSVAGTAGTELRRLFEWAIAAGRRVRSETGIGHGGASVPSASVELARLHVGYLETSVVLIMGTGELAQLTAKRLVRSGAKRLLFVGRSHSSAARLAATYGGRSLTLDRLDEALTCADVAISAARASQPILHLEQLRRALLHRHPGSATLLLIDLGVPRNVDPAVSQLADVEIHTIDDVSRSVERAVGQRAAELPAAEAILRREVARFAGWLHRREAARAWHPHRAAAPRWPSEFVSSAPLRVT
jgi:glutamyl-tRNA reductase